MSEDTMFKKLFLISLLLIPSLPALAEMPKVWRSRGNDFYLRSGHFNQPSKVTYAGEKTLAPKKRRATRCGTINVSLPKDKSLIPPSLLTLPVQELPRCGVNTGELKTPIDPEKVGTFDYYDEEGEPRSIAAFQTPAGKIILPNHAPNTYVTTYLFFKKRTSRSDSCGLIRVLFKPSFRISPEQIGRVVIDLGVEKFDFVFADLPVYGPGKCIDGQLKYWIYPNQTTDGTYGYFAENELPETLIKQP